MKHFGALALLSAALLAGPAMAQNADMQPPPARDLTVKPLGGLAPVPPAPGPAADRRGARMLSLTESRDAAAPPPPSRAAEFSFRRGPMEVKVQCGENEPVKPCADAAVMLMDKFATMTGGGPAEPPAPLGPKPTEPKPDDAVPAQ